MQFSEPISMGTDRNVRDWRTAVTIMATQRGVMVGTRAVCNACSLQFRFAVPVPPLRGTRRIVAAVAGGVKGEATGSSLHKRM